MLTILSYLSLGESDECTKDGIVCNHYVSIELSSVVTLHYL